MYFHVHILNFLKVSDTTIKMLPGDALLVVFLGAFRAPLKHWENTLSYRSPRRGFPRVHRRRLHGVALMILFSSWTVLSSVLDVTSVLLSCHAQNQGKFKLVRRTNSCSWRLWFYHANALAIFFLSFFSLWNEILSNTSFKKKHYCLQHCNCWKLIWPLTRNLLFWKSLMWVLNMIFLLKSGYYTL